MREKGVVLDQTLTNLGVSGFRKANRVKGNFGKFLALVEAGKVPRVSYLVVKSLDRISRQEVLDVLPAFTDLLNAGITIASLIDVQEYSRERIIRDPTALIICIITMIRPNDESKVKSERVG